MTRLSFEAMWSTNTQALTKLTAKLDTLFEQIEKIGQLKVKPEVDVDTRKAEQKLDGFGSRAVDTAKLAGAGAALAFGGALWKSMDVARTTDKLAAQLRLTADESARVGGIAGKLYASAYGENLSEVSAAVGAVVSSIDGLRAASSADLEDVTAKALNFARAFDIDVSRAALVAGVVIKSGLAKDATGAFDLMTAAAGKVPAALREDILDAAEEYAQFFDILSIGGEQAFSLLVAGAEKGRFGIDKAGDAIKEFTIRATDMSTASKISYDLLGLSQQQMTDRLLAGGAVGEQAFAQIVAGLRGIDNPARQSQAALGLFGTPLEDLGVDSIPQFLAALAGATNELGTVAGATAELGATLNDNAGTNLETFKRQVSTTFVDFVGGKALPALTEFAATIVDRFGPALQSSVAWIKENEAWLRPLATVVGTMIGTLLVLVGITKAWAAAMAVLNVVMNANPIGIVIIALAGLAAGLIYAYNHSETFRKIVQGAWQGIQAAISFAWNNVIKPIFDFYVGYVRTILAPIVLWLWDTIIKPVFSQIGAHISWVWSNLIRPAFDLIKSGVELVAKAFAVNVDAIGRIWDGIREKTRGPINFVIDTVINNGIGKVWNMLAGFVGHGMAKFPRLPLIGVAAGSAGAPPQRQMAGGGPVRGGIPNKDSVPLLGMDGEFMFSKAAVRNLGGTAVVAALHRAARLGRSLTEILFGGDRSSPGVAMMADGGAVTRGLAFARAQVGKPYLWGGVGPRGYDCSGLMSAMVGTLTGTNPYLRRFATASFAGGRAAAGFVPGLRSAFGIGVVQGNPGHMAGTLGGINVEATPPRVVMGAGARGADHPLFSHRFSLPQVGGEFLGGGRSSAEYVQRLFEGPLNAIAGLARFGQSQYITGVASMAKRIVTDTAAAIVRQLPGFGGGGVVPGPLGAPRTIIAHGGETVGYDRPAVHIDLHVHGNLIGIDEVVARVNNAIGRATVNYARGS